MTHHAPSPVHAPRGAGRGGPRDAYRAAPGTAGSQQGAAGRAEHERRSSMHLRKFNEHLPIAGVLTAASPKRHHALREVRNVDNDHHDYVHV